jgi:hypothetical protein
VKDDGVADGNPSLAADTNAHAGSVDVQCGRHRGGDTGND